MTLYSSFKFNLVTMAIHIWQVFCISKCISCNYSNHISGVMVCVLDSLSGQTKDYKINICFISVKHATLRRKSKDWLARNQIRIMSNRKQVSKHNKNERVGLVHSGYHYHLIEYNLFSPCYSWEIVNLVLTSTSPSLPPSFLTTHSLTHHLLKPGWLTD